LNYALECDVNMPEPHLTLGILALMNRDMTTARHEFLANLEGGAAQPPDTASIWATQYDALWILLKYG